MTSTETIPDDGQFTAAGEQMLTGNIEDTTAASDGGSDGEPPHNVSAFQKLFDLEIGKVLVTDNETGETLVMYKARASTGEENVSDEVFNAIMGLIEQMTGGNL